MTTVSAMPRRLHAASVLAMTMAGGIARGSTLLSQVLVGLFLSEREVGTYAVAVGITGFTCLFRGGGASHYLPTIRADEYDTASGRIFWWGFWFRLFAAAMTLAAAFALPSLELADPPPRLAETLHIFALSQVLLAFSIVGRIRMAVHQRFTQLARLDVGLAVFRVTTTAVLAWGGAGPLALVIPIAMAPLIEIIYFLANGTLHSITYRWSGGTVRQTAAVMFWPAIVSILLSLDSQLNFLVVKPMLALASLGVYYFAYQLASQPVLFLAAPLTSVLATHFAAQRGDRKREALAMVSTASGAVLFASLVCCGMIALFPSAERLLWAGKWSAAQIPVLALAGAACWSTAVGILGPALGGLRRFRAMASFEALKGVGIFAGAALGAVLVSLEHEGRLPLPESLLLDSTLVSLATATAIALMSIAQLIWLLRAHGARVGTVVQVLTRGPALGALAALAAMTVAAGVADLLPEGMVEASPRRAALVECATAGVLYAGLALFIVRVAAVNATRDCIALLPERPQALARRTLRL
jgi:O-antigen/teichoic acid export membrane protein